MMEVPPKGNIRDYRLPKVLASLNQNRKTGTLTVMTPEFIKKVYLNRGDAIFSSSTHEGDRLGEMLVRAGKITREQYKRSVEELLKRTGKRQGTILVELGYLTPKQLFWGVKYQVREIICSLFQLEDGEYEFEEGAIPTDEVITLKMSMGSLIYECVKKIENLNRIKNEMPGMDAVLMLTKNPLTVFQNIELSQQESTMLSIIDGKKTMRELINKLPGESFETLKTLYMLWSIGMVEGKKAEEEVVTEETVSVEEVVSATPDEEEAFFMRVDELYTNLDRLSPHELLEINESSDAEMIKKNYYKLSKDFHPDRYFSSYDPLLRDKLNTIFDAITKAYNMLKDDEERRRYFHSLGEFRKTIEADHKEYTAEEQFKRGVDEFKKGNFWGAADSFKWAIKLAPENAKYWSYLSLSYTKMPNRLKDAEEALLKAIKLEPQNGEHYVNLGLIYLKADMKKRAASQFEKALKLDPENIKAKKGLEQTRH